MIRWNDSIFPRRFFIPGLCVSLGLLLGFWMDYSHGRDFGASLWVLDYTANEKYAALAVSACAVLCFGKNKAKAPPHAGWLFQHSFKAMASLLVLAFFSYCLLPSSVRNAAFKLGITSFLHKHPEEAATLRKLLIEKKPDPESALPYYSGHPEIGDSWRARIKVNEIVYSKHCNILVCTSHRSRYKVAVFLDRVDEATAKKVVVKDAWRLNEQLLFSTTTSGVTLVWVDIT